MLPANRPRQPSSSSQRDFAGTNYLETLRVQIHANCRCALLLDCVIKA